MALPIGAFTAGVAGITSNVGGAYQYAPGNPRPDYYAGEFVIDTGYDDPFAFTTGLQAADVYAARVYGATGNMNSAPASGTYVGDWRIAATPIWARGFYAGTGVQMLGRVLIRCVASLANPYNISEGSWQNLASVDWSLYRI